MKSENRQKGMLLVEVLVALLLFVVGILGLVKAMGISQSIDAGGSWRLPPAGFSDSPALPKEEPPNNDLPAAAQQQLQQGTEETENPAKRARMAEAGEAE